MFYFFQFQGRYVTPTSKEKKIQLSETSTKALSLQPFTLNIEHTYFSIIWYCCLWCKLIWIGQCRCSCHFCFFFILWNVGHELNSICIVITLINVILLSFIGILWILIDYISGVLSTTCIKSGDILATYLKTCSQKLMI